MAFFNFFFSNVFISLLEYDNQISMPISKKRFEENKKELIEDGKAFGKDIAQENADEILRGNENVVSEVMDNYTQYDSYANIDLPKIRAMAGCKDSGYGTYQNCSEKDDYRVDELMEAWIDGISDGFDKEAKKIKLEFKRQFKNPSNWKSKGAKPRK